jgi:N-acetylneuraminate synthase
MVKTFVIAECANTWRIGTKSARHIEYAKKCILIAKRAGADAVKFQWTSDTRKMEQRRKVPDGTYTMLAWPQAWLNVFAAECERVGIEFMCSVFLPKDVATIAPFVKQFKIASLEASDFELFDACEFLHKPIIVSCGAMEYDELDAMVSSVASCDVPVSLLHCVASYPAPIDQMNLGVFRSRHGSPFTGFSGLSDHSGDVLTGALAVACGAEIIEVHFRLDETRKDNADFAHSHDPWSLGEYIAAIRKAELMLGDGVKCVQPSEQAIRVHRVVS